MNNRRMLMQKFGVNLFANATIAFSLRDLGLVATDVIRVRRSSDNAEQDFTPTEIIDGTLTTFTGANDGFVTIWYDQVGINNMIQPIALKQPQIVENGLVYMSGGKPIIKRTRDDVGMYSTYAPNGTNRQIFAVLQSQYLSVKKNMLLGSQRGSLDFAYTSEDGSTSTLINSNVTLSNERKNGATFTYTTRNNVYSTLVNKSLLSFDANFAYITNQLSFGYRPDSVIDGFSMYDMQFFVLFETPEPVEPIESYLNNLYTIF